MIAPRMRALTFDCYGTLIDWDRGIRTALAGLPSLAGCDLEQLVREREQAELPLLAGPFRLYGEILAESLAVAAAAQGRALGAAEVERFAASMARWPAFPDSAAALLRLSRRFPLAILSNVESQTLHASVELLGAPFAALVTAEELHSYKPAPAHFAEALRRLGLPHDALLHVAGSLYHDIRPARAFGLEVAWIDRRGEGVPREFAGLRSFPSLASFADALLGPQSASGTR